MFIDRVRIIVHSIMIFLLVIIRSNHKGVREIDVMLRVFGVLVIMSINNFIHRMTLTSL